MLVLDYLKNNKNNFILENEKGGLMYSGVNYDNIKNIVLYDYLVLKEIKNNVITCYVDLNYYCEN